MFDNVVTSAVINKFQEKKQPRFLTNATLSQGTPKHLVIGQRQLVAIEAAVRDSLVIDNVAWTFKRKSGMISN